MNDAPHTPPQAFAKGYALLFALLPWSIDVSFGSWNLNLPSEPLMALLAPWLALEIARSGNARRLFNHRFFLLSAAWIGWMGVSVCFSSMPVVSLKYWLVESAQWWLFAVGMAFWPALWRQSLPWFEVSMAGVALYTMAHHSLLGFRADQALLSPMPFFPDHTLYAAVLAMVLFFWQIQYNVTGFLGRIASHKSLKIIAMLYFMAALALSTCRAALVSVAAVAGVLVLIFLGKKSRWLVAAGCVAGMALFWGMSGKIAASVARDVSMQERLNRWDCAASMLAERPVTGWGPGTYQFQYIPFQKPEKMTRISVSAPFTHRGPDTYGRGGDAHSEYWLAAADMGYPGLVLWVLLVVFALWNGFRKALNAPNQASRRIALLLTLGLLTYFAHAFLNDFLHDARVAALVWGGMAGLCPCAECRRKTTAPKPLFPAKW